MLVPLSIFARRRGWPYSSALNRVTSGRLAGAIRLGDRWYVADDPKAPETPPNAPGADSPPPPEAA